MMVRSNQRGLSLVELMVGAALGLIVVAAAGSVVAAHQGAARRVQVEARLMQDLRGAAELVARDLRRAGHWAAAASGVRHGDELISANPHADISTSGAVAAAASNAIDANIASGRDDVDVGTPLLNRNFLVIRGSDSCPSEPRTEPYQL
jgi:type IV pilus assembly protein PilW